VAKSVVRKIDLPRAVLVTDICGLCITYIVGASYAKASAQIGRQRGAFNVDSKGAQVAV